MNKPTDKDAVSVGIPSMTLRDWFAGQALAGLANAGAQNIEFDAEPYAALMAGHAYTVADAMLAERAKK